MLSPPLTKKEKCKSVAILHSCVSQYCTKTIIIIAMLMNNSNYCRKFYLLYLGWCKSSCCTKTQFLWGRDNHSTCDLPLGDVWEWGGGSLHVCRRCLAVWAPRTQPPRGCSPSTSKRPPLRCRYLRSRSNQGFFLPSLPGRTPWWHWCWP